MLVGQRLQLLHNGVVPGVEGVHVRLEDDYVRAHLRARPQPKSLSPAGHMRDKSSGARGAAEVQVTGLAPPSYLQSFARA